MKVPWSAFIGTTVNLLRFRMCFDGWQKSQQENAQNGTLIVQGLDLYGWDC